MSSGELAEGVEGLHRHRPLRSSDCRRRPPASRRPPRPSARPRCTEFAHIGRSIACGRSMTSSGSTSSIDMFADSRFCARPIRPARKSARICSCCCAIKSIRVEQLLQRLGRDVRRARDAAAFHRAACVRVSSARRTAADAAQVFQFPPNEGRKLPSNRVRSQRGTSSR